MQVLRLEPDDREPELAHDGEAHRKPLSSFSSICNT